MDNNKKTTPDHNTKFAKKIDELTAEYIKSQQEMKSKIIDDANKDEESDTISFGDLLLDGILTSASDIASNEAYIEKINEIISQKIFTRKQIPYLYAIINMMVSQIAYTSILLYDDLLKDEIQKQLDHVGEHINLAKSDIEALKAVVQIHSKQLSQIQDKTTIDGFKKDNGLK